jgi:hypothetical protein
VHYITLGSCSSNVWALKNEIHCFIVFFVEIFHPLPKYVLRYFINQWWMVIFSWLFQRVWHWHIKNPTDFVHWFCILLLSPNCLSNIRGFFFLEKSLESFKYKIKSANRDYLMSSLIFVSLLAIFLALLLWLRIQVPFWISIGRVDTLVSFLILSRMLAMFFTWSLYYVEIHFSYSYFLQDFPHCKLYYRVIVTKTSWNWQQQKRHVDQWNRIKDPEINPSTYSHLIFAKRAKNIHWRKYSLWERWISTCRQLKLHPYFHPI